MKKLLPVTALLISLMATAEFFEIPSDDSTVVGRLRVITPRADNTLLDIARRFDVGYHEITWANPNLDIWTPKPNARVIIPAQYILPLKPWRGIVINISQRRLFYFLPVKKGETAQLLTMPISIARQGWPTPLGETKVIAKHKDPGWFVPKSIQQEKIQEGEIDFPTYFPPGPDNPMGMLAIQTGFSGIFIHGTNRPWGVGMRTSHGCLHLYPEDAETLFPLMKPGIPIRIIDQPFVVGVDAGQLLMTRYQSVTDYGATTNQFTRAILALAPWLESGGKPTDPTYDVDWEKIQNLTQILTVTPLSIAPDSADLSQLLANLPVEAYDLPPYDHNANDARPPAPPMAMEVEMDEFDAEGLGTEEFSIEGYDIEGYETIQSQ
ncbi:MAG: L,D-transpeptidase family protein [Porticoccaceae bacterium]|nr:L,D-transpeptidase family protein [Porticoccaceae bacterium]